MRFLIAAALLSAPLLAASLPAAAATPDEHFYRSLAEAGIAEVGLGKLAQEKGADQAVKDFGAMMVKDHSAANDKLQALASSKNVSLPNHPSVGAEATKAKLEVLKGNTFDKSYIKSQVTAHEQAVALLQKEIASGQDADAKAFAQQVLPTIRAHLQAIRSLAAQENVKVAGR